MAVGPSGATSNGSVGRRGLLSEIYFQDPAVNEARFDTLFHHKDEVEAVYGAALTRERLEGRKGCRIGDLRDGDVDRADEWPDYLDWLMDTAEAAASDRRSGWHPRRSHVRASA